MHTKDFLKGQLKYMVLKSLKEKPLHGYAIASEIEKQTFGYWKPAFGSLYPMLSQMQKEKLIALKKESKKGRKIKTYKILQNGLKEVEKEEKYIGRMQEKILELCKTNPEILKMNPGEVLDMFSGFFLSIQEEIGKYPTPVFLEFILKQKAGKIKEKQMKEFKNALLEFLSKVEKINKET